jgi:hypothetical protein
VRTSGFVPGQLLGGGWPALTLGTPIAFGAQAEVGTPTQDGEVPEREPLLHPVQFRNHSATLSAFGPFQSTFDRDRAVATGVRLALQHPHLRDIQRNGDLSVIELCINNRYKQQKVLNFEV